MQLNKDKIRLRFTRAAATYDNEAVIQLKVAERLMTLLNEYITIPPARILEIGSCTGLLTARLQKILKKNMSTIYVNDLIPDFKSVVWERLDHDPRLVFLAGDIEKIDIPDNLDLAVSSSTLHWLEDLPTLFQKLSNNLVPGGTLCFSIYGMDNLLELREITGIGLKYYSLEEIKNLVNSYFEILACDEEHLTLRFDDPLALLNHLRDTGVNALDTVPWTKSQLTQFQQTYTTRFSHDEQVVLTYHPIYCLAKKR